LLSGTDRFEQTDRPSDSGETSLVICAWAAYGTATALSAQTATAAVSRRIARNLRISPPQPGMERRQRPAHEARDLALCCDAGRTHRGRERRIAGPQQLVHLADVLDLKRRRPSHRSNDAAAERVGLGQRGRDHVLVPPLAATTEVRALHARRHVDQEL